MPMRKRDRNCCCYQAEPRYLLNHYVRHVRHLVLILRCRAVNLIHRVALKFLLV